MIEWFIDAHAHASTLGLGYDEVVRRFRSSGGKLIVLVQLNPASYGLDESLDGVMKSLELHVKLCNEVKKKYGGTMCFSGLHPSTVDKLVRSNRGVERVYRELEENYMKKLELLLSNGLLDGLGEFGRPHYPSPPESWVVNELLLLKSFTVAKDTGTKIHIHSENAGLVTYKSIKLLVDSVGLPHENVLMHHVPPSQVEIYTRDGFYVSVVGKSQAVSGLSSECTNVLIESDYLDDPRRPGAVVYPWDIRREVLKAVNEGRLSSVCAEKVLQFNPAVYYKASL
ncbi:MAG: TatD family hydrolase [Sulfolobales archaeon]